MSKKKIAILPGDGAGPEVMAEARRALEWFVARLVCMPGAACRPMTAGEAPALPGAPYNERCPRAAGLDG